MTDNTKRMLYTEFLQLWASSVQKVDAQDWQGCVSTLEQITEPTARTLFNMASAYLALGRPDQALSVLDLALVKDEHLAVGFFQRSTVMMLLDRLEEALSDCIWAQKHMRENPVIDYKQLGLRFKLHIWQVLYNAAAVYTRMGRWDQAQKVLESVSREKTVGIGVNIETAIDHIKKGEVLAPMLVPEGVVFRPNKREVNQLKERDFLGKAKVISSMIPNDDFGGFEPLRLQKPGFYEPKSGGAQDSRYMQVKVPYMSCGAGQLTVPAGATVFLFGEEDRDGMVSVIYDGQRGLLPVSLLEPVDVRSSKARKKSFVPNGIPLPPDLKPPTRPHVKSTPVPPPRARHRSTPTPPPSYISTITAPPPDPAPITLTDNSDIQLSDNPQAPEAGPVQVKVRFTQTLSMSVPLDSSYQELRERIAQTLGQTPSEIRLRRKPQGSRLLLPLDQDQDSPLLDLAQSGSVQLWCQKEDPLLNRTILHQMVALYDYTANGPEDLEFSEGDTIDILGQVNEEWMEGHCAGNVGIFPACFVYRENTEVVQD
ncbi:NADPH oxidase activator 1-like isoform X2 [Periophthalmus magnuspinnatus]|uniref:NADPH oxidase activator 1-like isoform X2 n=1 Tax=Periophthalmus magnuspinnatus TaxID=409849 RepID=UPI0024370447|nr:NADPH oxidase activator 1-like isoform X2 [Periophthalmus magnuspinnatus]